MINIHVSISFRFFSLLNYYKILSIVPCAMGRTSGGGSGVAKSRTQLSMHACHSHLLSPGRSGHYDCLPINIGHSVTLRIFCNAMFSSCMMWKIREDSFGIYLPHKSHQQYHPSSITKTRIQQQSIPHHGIFQIYFNFSYWHVFL